MRKLKLFKNVPAEGIALTTVFIVVLTAVIAAFAVTPKRTFSEEENRSLQQFPKFSFNELFEGKFTKKFESYLADQFPARDFFVGVNCDAQLAEGKKDVGGVYIGKNNYLFEVLTKPNEDVLQANIDGIKTLAEKSKKPVYVMPVPSSAQEMPDCLPKNAPSYSQNEAMNEIESQLSSKAKVVNIMDEMKPSENEQFYFRTDHHWNAFGAYKGYSALMNAMDIKPNPIEDYNLKKVSSDFYGTLYSKSGYKFQKPDDIYVQNYKIPQNITCTSSEGKSDSALFMSNLRKKDKYTVYLGGNHAKDVIKNASSSGKRVLIIKDSYAHIAVPYMLPHFSEIHLIDLRYFYDDVFNYIRDNKIDEIVVLYSIKQLGEAKTLDILY